MADVKLIFILLIVALLIFAGPALLLWAVGTLVQGEGLDLTFWNWLAAAVTLALFNARGNSV